METKSRTRKPEKIDIAEELGFNQTRVPAIGPGSLKPNMGRGGLPLSDESYYGLEHIDVPKKKGPGIGDRVKQEKTKKVEGKKDKPSWSDVL